MGMEPGPQPSVEDDEHDQYAASLDSLFRGWYNGVLIENESKKE